MLIGLVISHFTLKKFKNRIEDSRNLLRIIPNDVKKKHEEVNNALTNKQLNE